MHPSKASGAPAADFASIWVHPSSLAEVYAILESHEHKRVRLVCGNTGYGRWDMYFIKKIQRGRSCGLLKIPGVG